MLNKLLWDSDGQFNVSFGYQCSGMEGSPYNGFGDASFEEPGKTTNQLKKSSFSLLTGAAVSANCTLANTNICNGLIGEGLLPCLDSPKTFRRVPSSPSLSSLDILSSSLQSNGSYLSGFLSSQSDCSEWNLSVLKPTSAPSRSQGFLNAMEVQLAGGAAGEDRVQAFCSEENGWLCCAIYDGFNGRDAADFLAGTLYENIGLYLNVLDSQLKHNNDMVLNGDGDDIDHGFFQYEDGFAEEMSKIHSSMIDLGITKCIKKPVFDSYKNGVLDCLQHALAQAESDFIYMVEQEMDDRPDLVSIGSCVLVVLLHQQDLFILSLGDSRAVLATIRDANKLEAIQLNECHSVDNETEQMRVLSEHPDDPKTIVHGKVKGKLKLTRAFGVGYLKKKNMNDALMGILRVPNLSSPPYVSTQPSLNFHRVSRGDRFVLVASDGLFDFFSNAEAVELVSSFFQSCPLGNPAEFIVEQLVLRAAQKAGFTLEELMRVPSGMRRKYHDDVTVIVILLGSHHRTSTASTH
ncbi:hypothetical protein J5N97_008928 [Dioscorea zingiberensis]|uniref:protein-serine/threonine phosphatase n=1 Tax=Dioscorea zingiberensis TaxID=325984 RepID=A0A9D5HLA9_9LILI|nr:hypothetical protein J5N97_008928 [Dioscorea zingiberensis]